MTTRYDSNDYCYQFAQIWIRANVSAILFASCNPCGVQECTEFILFPPPYHSTL